jgi:uncharacterized protein YoxC
MDPNQQYNNQMPPPGGMQGQGGMPAFGGGQQDMGSSTTSEELIEAIIEEKWNDLVKDIEKIAQWKTATESRLARIEQSVKDISSNFDQLHQGILGKVGEYDKHILDVGTELKAMEKVFEKVLPLFTENVAALSHITSDFKTMLGTPVPQTPKEEKPEASIVKEKDEDKPF